MKKMLCKVLSLVLTLCLMLSAMPVTASAASIRLNKTEATILVGKKVKLKVKGTKNKVTWESSKKDVATVNAKGKVKGINAGEATITARVDGETLTCAVIVKEKESTPVVEIERDFSVIEEITTASVGDFVTLGSYEQDNNTANGAEAIEWQILDKKDGKVLLLSKYGLEQKKFHDKYELVTWETCSLRSWMNDEFYKTAFTSEEQKFIANSYLLNNDNPKHRTDGGNPTYDKVFLLSLDEVKTYFNSAFEKEDPARGAQLTEHTKAQGAPFSKTDGYYGNGWWWLRSPGGVNGKSASAVCKYGDVDLCGFYIDDKETVVRPALWLEVE